VTARVGKEKSMLAFNNVLKIDTELYRLSQEERLIFWEVIISVILSKKIVYVHVSFSE
jgi:hypothetical protein